MLPEDYALCTLLYPHSDSQCSGDLLRSHQPDLGHVAIHRPQGVWENRKRIIPLGVDPSGLFSWAQHIVALNKIGFLLAREKG